MIFRVLIISMLAGCSTGDELRMVNPVTWHELKPLELHEECRNWSAETRGCVVSRPDGDHIYTLPVVRQ